MWQRLKVCKVYYPESYDCYKIELSVACITSQARCNRTGWHFPNATTNEISWNDFIAAAVTVLIKTWVWRIFSVERLIQQRFSETDIVVTRAKVKLFSVEGSFSYHEPNLAILCHPMWIVKCKPTFNKLNVS